MANFLTTINCQQIPSSILIFSPNTKARFQTRTRSITSFPQSSSSFLSNGYSWNDKEKKRGFGVVTRAGPPSNTSLIFAFVFPLTLLLATIFTSIRIADKLDEDYLEELAINEAIMEGEEEEEEDEDSSTLTDEESAVPTWAQEKPKKVPRIRNRPKREAEV